MFSSLIAEVGALLPLVGRPQLPLPCHAHLAIHDFPELRLHIGGLVEFRVLARTDSQVLLDDGVELDPLQVLEVLGLYTFL